MQLTVRKVHLRTSRMNESVSRRRFLSRGVTGLSAVWASAHWPALLAAATHAHQAAKSAAPPKFEFFTPEELKFGRRCRFSGLVRVSGGGKQGRPMCRGPNGGESCDAS